MELLLTCRRIDGKFLITYLRDAETGQCVVTVPCNFWRKGKPRKEVGGPPPRPALPEPGIELAEALCERRRTHKNRAPTSNLDVWFNRPEPETDLTAALEASLRIYDAERHHPEDAEPVWRVHFTHGSATATDASLIELIRDEVMIRHVVRVERL